MKPLLLALGAALLASCQSMSGGVLALEARALALEDTDEDLSGYGGHVALNTPVVDFLVGVDQREIGTLDSTEAVLGVRRRFLEIWKLRPFVEADYLIGMDLFDDVSGWSAVAIVRLDEGVQLPDLEEAAADAEDKLGGVFTAELAIIDADEKVHDGGLERGMDAVAGEFDVLVIKDRARVGRIDVGVVDDDRASFEGEDAFGHGLARGEKERGEREEHELHGGRGEGRDRE
ncbi:hypothetical protein N9247_01095 [bacterium]|nr:hypothetical protein [bacterium]